MEMPRQFAKASTLAAITLIVVSFSSAFAHGLSCINYTTTTPDFLPENVPYATGCRSCSRGVFVAHWPLAPSIDQPAMYTWTCSSLSVHLPSIGQLGYNQVDNNGYPTDQECAMGSYELASPSAGYLALCTCCFDFCNIGLTCKTFPTTSSLHGMQNAMADVNGLLDSKHAINKNHCSSNYESYNVVSIMIHVIVLFLGIC